MNQEAAPAPLVQSFSGPPALHGTAAAAAFGSGSAATMAAPAIGRTLRRVGLTWMLGHWLFKAFKMFYAHHPLPILSFVHHHGAKHTKKRIIGEG